MSRNTELPPGQKPPPKPSDAATARRERSAQALRDNLRRRKMQARGRTAAEKDEPVAD